MHGAMFLRVRGKGACPENSQAAVMHLRGFRFTPCPPPQGFRQRADVAHTPTTATLATSETSASQPLVHQREVAFVFPHFAVGIHNDSIPKVQAQHLFATPEAKASSSAAAINDCSTSASLAWKEVWNLYDILYDEVPLFPTNFHSTSQLLRTLAAPHDGEVVAALHDFSPLTTREGNHKTVVCTHYFAVEPMSIDVQASAESCRAAASSLPADARAGPAIVLDLRHLSPDTAATKLVLELAWLLAYTAMQSDAPLVHARAVVAMFPYPSVPTPQVVEERADAPAHRTVHEAFALLGEHVELVYRGALLSLMKAATDITDAHKKQLQALLAAGAPPLFCIGTAELHRVRLLLQRHPSSTATPSSSSSVVLVCGDHHDSSRSDAQRAALAQACSTEWDVEVQLLPAPLRSLLEGGEEAWDPYVQRERTRQNYCPCCGSCGHEHEEGHHH